MPSSILALAAAFGTVISAASLADVCTTTHLQSVLPTTNLYAGAVALTIDPSSATANAVYNLSSTGSVMFPNTVVNYCNVTFAYSNPGRNNKVNVWFGLPAPSDFKNRYLSTGGGGYAINSGAADIPGGIQYGAVTGFTDGGFGGFNTQFDAVFPLQNGTANYDALYMFGYEAHHQLTTIGKQLSKSFYAMQNGTKLYSYYQGKLM